MLGAKLNFTKFLHLFCFIAFLFLFNWHIIFFFPIVIFICLFIVTLFTFNFIRLKNFLWCLSVLKEIYLLFMKTVIECFLSFKLRGDFINQLTVSLEIIFLSVSLFENTNWNILIQLIIVEQIRNVVVE